MNKQHDYHSPLRQEQAKRTREQILEGLIRALAQGGIADLSIPAVAREAGVSVPTIYRYFHTKHELIQALYSYSAQRAGINTVPSEPQLPHGLEGLMVAVKEVFIKYERADETLRAAITSEASYEMRKQALPLRLKIIEEALAPVAEHFNEADRLRLRNMVLILTTTSMVRAFKDYLDLSGEEAADTVAWTIRMLTNVSSPQEKINGQKMD